MGIFGDILRATQPKLVEEHIDGKLEALDSQYFSVPEAFFQDKNVEDAFLWFGEQVKLILRDFEVALQQEPQDFLPFTWQDRLFIDAQKQKVEEIVTQAICTSLDTFVEFCRLKFQSLGFEFESYRQSVLEIVFGKQQEVSNKNLSPSTIGIFQKQGYNLTFSQDFPLTTQEKNYLHQYLISGKLCFERYPGMLWSVCKFDTHPEGRGCRIIALGKFIIGCYTHLDYDRIFTDSNLRKGENFPSILKDRFAHLL